MKATKEPIAILQVQCRALQSKYEQAPNYGDVYPIIFRAHHSDESARFEIVHPPFRECEMYKEIFEKALA